jgi:ubiquinone/menaquinone biosynthesis C-methylase UbiE
MAEQKHQDIMAALVPLPGAKVIDVGCGNGRITRLIAAASAQVIGIDPGQKQLERARADAPVNGETYIEGSAENLPVADASADIVFFFNSLHHVPEAVMDKALDEARRALKPQGWLFIAEPLAEGPQFLMQQPLNDETEVRALEDFYRRAGIHAVPAVIINDHHLISGGQPVEVFERALREIAVATL